MKRTILLLFTALSPFSCKSDKEYPYEYWSRLFQEKYREIIALTESVTCTDIEEFQIQGNFMVHASIKKRFDQLVEELNHIQNEAWETAKREGYLIYDTSSFLYPPVGKKCQDGKAKLIFASDLSLEEINEELRVRYQEIKNFYNNVKCTSPEDWTTFTLQLADCCFEAIAMHKTIRRSEAVIKVETYNRLMEQKRSLENISCAGDKCNNMFKPITCVNERAIAEMGSE